MGALDGKVAIVVGSSRGIGKGIALELGAAGAHVVVGGRTLRPGAGQGGSLEETAAAIVESGGSATPLACDFLDDVAVADLFATVGRDFGRLDVLVNSAFNTQLFGPSIGSKFWELPIDIWRDVVDVGTRTAYTASVYGTPLLIRSGGGLIANISGRGAGRYRFNVAYGVGKAALDKMTKDMAHELADQHVSVVSLWPNITRTENLEAGVFAKPNGESPFGDLDLLETPRDCGRAVVAMATDEQNMERTGGRYWVAELAKHYGFTDEHGRSHPLPS